MRNSACFAVALSMIFAYCHTATAQDAFPFKEGDRVMFLGDSITEQYQYSSDIERYLATRFPAWKLSFMNAGIGGDTATGGANRFQKHVLDEKPTIVTINFGMNDGGYGGFDANRHKPYVENTAKMLTMAKDAGVRAVLISPNAVDWRKNKDRLVYLETQKQFYAPLKEIAAAHHVPFVDQYATTRATLEKLVVDKADNVDPFPDSVHTDSDGGLLMAYAILTGLKAPAMVSEATVGQVGDAQTTRCAVTNVKRGDGSIEFDRLDDSLPFPTTAEWDGMLPYVNNLTDLNWYGLKVPGLAAGTYTIAIDGVEIAKHSTDELSKGVNLGNVRVGPVFAQAKKVSDLINAKNAIVHSRFRGVILANVPDWLADVAAERKPMELAKRKQLIDEKQSEIHALAMPVAHHWEVKLVR
jgi:lysophospholipase L1-like esterase